MVNVKSGRNDPCPCGSGEKHKKCCQSKLKATVLNKEPTTIEAQQTASLFNEGNLAEMEKKALLLVKKYPNSGFAWEVLGTALHMQGKDSLLAWQKVVFFLPDTADGHNNLGIALQNQGQLDAAVASYQRALGIKPDYPDAHYNLGNTLRDLGQLNNAVASYRRALEIKPDYAETLNNLGNVLRDIGQLNDAVTCYRRALEIKPDYVNAYSNLLFCLSQSEAVDVQELFTEHCRFGKQFEDKLHADRMQHPRSQNPQRCLQIGFVSGDLQNHAVANFIEPVLIHLADYAQLELHAYSNSAVEDSTTRRLQGYFKHWNSIALLSDANMAEKIRADGIDILIDLSGHTGKHRLLTFARKPAPLQASWMGYPGTTGLSAMDYYLADRFLLPPGKFNKQFTEKIVHLPANAPFLPSSDAPSINDLPALTNGFITFGSFNHPGKITRSTITLWAQLLRSLPDSRFLLGGMPKNDKYGMLIEWFAQEGITQERLIIHYRCGIGAYLSLHHQVDICLDTFPYNGGTTTHHALWMGVPTLTLAGKTAASRQGAAILGHVGLDDFIAHNSANFVQKGLSLAGNLAALSNIRCGLRERFAQSAMSQPALIAAGLERALRMMWQRWCADLPAESFDVSEQNPPAVSTDQLVNQSLIQAIEQQQAGNLQLAEHIYRTILQINPSHPDANHNLGVMTMRVNQLATALDFFTTALNADPSQSQYWLSYIDALLQTGQFEEAEQTLTLARQQGLQGDAVDALSARLSDRLKEQHQSPPPVPQAALQQNQLKKIAKQDKSPKKPTTLKEKNPSARDIQTLVSRLTKGRHAEAANLAKKMTEHFPHYVFGWKALGIILKQTGQDTDALLAMQKAALLSPNDVEIHYNLGNLFHEFGRFTDAVTSFRRALQIKPDYADAHNNLGNILNGQGCIDEAETSFRRALQIKPDYAEAHNNLGVILKKTGRLTESDSCFLHAIEANPNYAEAHYNLGNGFLHRGRIVEATTYFRRALQLKPDYEIAHNNLAVALISLGQLDEAVTNCRLALNINPEYAEAHTNMGNALQALGLHDDAVASYRSAIKFKPDDQLAYDNMLFCLGHCDALDPKTVFSEYLLFAERFEAPLRDSWPQHTQSRDPERCLQIGIVSGDLRNHAIAYFIEPVLIHLAGYAKLELHAYSNSTVEDSVTRHLQEYFKHWNPIALLSDANLAEKIRADGIDILIDLSGHTAQNRLLTFARKPAPLQATWMGYPGTTGLSAMDYYLADTYYLPQEKFDDQFTEKILYLPASAPFLTSDTAPSVNVLPAIENGFITFGSFNRLGKISQSVIIVWAQLLRALPDSRLLMGGMPEDGKFDILIEWFAQEGIGQERLNFHLRSNLTAYLNLHHKVDICLDTFPYNGGTTTHHALWMGVPTLTLAGKTAASRQGAAILGHIGLNEFIAHDAADFVEKGIFWSVNLAALSDIRHQLRERFSHSAMGQPEVIAKGLERALRMMWQRWCADLPAVSFDVSEKNPPAVSTDQLILQSLIQAIAQHQAGNLQLAEHIYRTILQINPSHPDANHNLGVMAMLVNQLDTALDFFTKALNADPTQRQYWLSYINALFQDNQLEQAREVMALARQQGLEGDEVDTLVLYLETAK